MRKEKNMNKIIDLAVDELLNGSKDAFANIYYYYCDMVYF